MRAQRPRSVKARSAVAAGAAVLVGSVLVSAVALVLVQGAVTRSLDDALSASAGGVIAQLSENPPSSGDPVQLPVLDPRDPVVVQIVDAAGTPVASTPGVDARARICPAGPRNPGVSTTTVDLAQPGLVGTFRVQTTETMADGVPYLVCAARSSDAAEATRRAVLVAMGLVILAVTALVVLLVARAVGAALSAVADLTTEADRLRNLDEGRLSVPDTGDEVEHLATTLNELLDRLHNQEKATRQFVADAGHELRTPLTSLRLELELAGSDGSDSSRAKAALGDVDRLTVLVDDLLVLARADAGQRPKAQHVTLPECIADEVTNANRLRDGVHVTLHAESATAVSDLPALRRAVRNLLSNAVRHAEQQVEVRVAPVGSWVVIEVLDDGPGVPLSETRRIFERFTRLDDARARDSGGSGLGLAIVAAYAQSSEGDVVAHPGPGGRFVLRLPRADPPQ